MTNKPQLGILLTWISLAVAGCTDVRSSAAPAAPSPISQPVPQPTGLQPTVTAITPNVGSTAGSAGGMITGTQFQSGATVQLGNGTIVTAYVLDDTNIWFGTSPTASPAGAVDVVVTNPPAA